MMKNILLLLSVFTFTTFAHAVYIGGSVGYLIDSEEDYEVGRIGMTLSKQGKTAHNLELELGHSYSERGAIAIRMLPVTLNYRAETDVSESAFIYYGAGIGSAFIDVEYFEFSDTGSSFVIQAFGGAGYRVSNNVSVLAGVRYLNMSSITVGGNDIGSENDFGFNFGVQISF